MADDLRTNAGRVADFLKSLSFEVSEIDRQLLAKRISTQGTVLQFRIGFEDEQTIARTIAWEGYFSTLSRQALFEPNAQIGKDYVIVTEDVKRSPERSRNLDRRARPLNISALSFGEFLRSFINLDALERNCRATMRLPRTANYVKPRIVTRGNELTSDEFIEEVVLQRFTPRLLVVHAPGGRGKTTFAEYLAGVLFQSARDHQTSVPFLIKFSEHLGITVLEALLQDALKRYGLVLDLTTEALDRLVKYGAVTLIFDGFDELSEKAGERLNVRNISDLAQKIHKSAEGHALLTCRSAFLTTNPRVLEDIVRQSEQDALVAEVREFSDEEIDKYLTANAPKWDVSGRNKARVQTYMRQEPRIADLAREPLVLQMISDAVFSVGSGLPRNEAELYEKFVASTCDRDAERHGLPPDLPQTSVLEAVAQFLVSFGEFTVSEEFLRMLIEEALAPYFAQHQTVPLERDALLAKLTDHYMFTPTEMRPSADIRFRHASFRDFLMARRLARVLGDDGAAAFLDRIGGRDLPDGVLEFLADEVDAGRAQELNRHAQAAGTTSLRNLIRFLAVWRRLRDVLPPPYGLAGKSLVGLTIAGQDLRGYVFTGTELDQVAFMDCDLSGCDLGVGVWRELRVDGCSLRQTDFGFDATRRINIDGEGMTGQRFVEGLRRYGALGPGIRTIERVAVETDPVPAMLTEIFRKVVEGDRRENTRVVNKLPDTFERGRVCAEHSAFIREKALPAVLDHHYLVPSGDRHGTLTASRQRLGEIVSLIFENQWSDDLGSLRELLSAAWNPE